MKTSRNIALGLLLGVSLFAAGSLKAARLTPEQGAQKVFSIIQKNQKDIAQLKNAAVKKVLTAFRQGKELSLGQLTGAWVACIKDKKLAKYKAMIDKMKSEIGHLFMPGNGAQKAKFFARLKELNKAS